MGIGGFLASVRMRDGRDAVLKLSPLGGEQAAINVREEYALRRLDGVGAVRVYNADLSRGALLLELCAPAERVVTQTHEHLRRSCEPVAACHGDLNPGNILSSQREPWLAIDPLPVIAPIAYDAASLVWSKRSWLFKQQDPEQTLVDRIRTSSRVLETSEWEIWAWTLVRALGLLINRFSWGGYNEEPFVAVVELLCSHRPA